MTQVTDDLDRIAMMVDSELEKAAGRKIPFSLVIHSEPDPFFASNCKRKIFIESMEKLLEKCKSDENFLSGEKK